MISIPNPAPSFRFRVGRATTRWGFQCDVANHILVEDRDLAFLSTRDRLRLAQPLAAVEVENSRQAFNDFDQHGDGRLEGYG